MGLNAAFSALSVCGFSRARGRVSLLILAAALAALLLSTSVARAEVAHVHSDTFNVPNSPTSIAVDRETGSVYVLTTTTPAANAGRIYKFDSGGSPQNFAALGSNELNPACTSNCRTITVDNSGGINQGVIYVGTTLTGDGASNKRGVRVFAANGRPSTVIDRYPVDQLSIPAFCGVGVDPQGVLHVTHNGSASFFEANSVSTFLPGQILPDPFPPQNWEPLAQIKNVADPSPCRGAVGPTSEMYILPNSAGAAIQTSQVLRYTVDPFAGGEPPSTVVDGESTNVAVNQANGDLFSNHRTSIVRLNAAGEHRETFGSGVLAESDAIGVNSEDSTVYAGNRTAKTVEIFAAVTTPDVLATSADAGQTNVELSATLGTAGAGDITSCEFEYGTTTAYGDSEPCAEATPYAGDSDVTASLSGLDKETTYHFRVVAGNADGQTLGPDQAFTTHNVADVETDEPTALSQVSATLNGSFRGDGDATSYYFEWGPTSAYGNTTPVTSAGTPTGEVAVSAPIEGLSPNLADSTPYHYRLVASNSAGTTLGPDREFFTQPPDAPALSGITIQSTSQTGASIAASINPQGAPTVFWIEYGPTSSYGSSTPQSESIGEDDSDHPVIAALAGLRPGTTYYYRFVAANFGGTSLGSDGTFSTPAPPAVESLGAAAVSETTALISAHVNPGFRATTYRLEYGLTRSYGGATAETVVGGIGGTGQPVSSEIGGLRPGVTYHFRLVATNEQGSVASANQTLTTQATPPRPRSVPLTCRKPLVKRAGKCVKAPVKRCRKGQTKKRGKCVRRKAKRCKVRQVKKRGKCVRKGGAKRNGNGKRAKR